MKWFAFQLSRARLSEKLGTPVWMGSSHGTQLQYSLPEFLGFMVFWEDHFSGTQNLWICVAHPGSENNLT